MPSCPQGHNSTTEDYCDECGARIATTAAAPPDASIETCPVCGAPRSGRFCEEDGYDFILRPPVSEAAGPTSGIASPAPQGADTVAYQAATSTGVLATSTGASVATAAGDAVTPVPEAAIPAGAAAARPVPAATPPAAAGTGLPATAGVAAVITADRWYYETVMAQHGPDAASIAFPAVYPPRRVPLAGPQMVIGRHSTSRGLNPEIDLTGPPEDPGVSHLHAVLQPHPDGGWTITDPGSTNGTTINDDPRPIEVGVPIPVRPGDRIHVGAWTTITLEPTP